MINEKEIEAVNLSATKKDFYQIWNELLDTASKLSERWDPTSTNESDPGIVLLKVLTAIADKLNYTIDKNTLEAFMPSAAQEESMRKLCEMLGYNMKYYQSAVTDVTVSYNGEKAISSCSALSSTGVILPIFTNIKNTDNDINYFTLETVNFDDTVNKTRSIACMEGETVLCGDDVDNIITISQIDDNYRYYLPENQIAENGIFIYNINDSNQSDFWEKVDNLNTQQVGKLCYKFGFDSKKQRPYVQFPDDISTIIEDGLVIRYTRTNGANGNISYNTLTTLEAPALWSDDTYKDASDILKVSNFAVKNPSATINGCNKETLNDAYNNYKKTIGTFDTLVTCRDYMNKIYQLTSSSSDQTPLVSNIIVSDIRDDINKAITLCTFNEYGIAYSDKSITTTETKTYPKAEGEGSVAVKIDMPKISNFDLVLYPFTAISGNVDKTSYQNSFKYTTVNKSEIEEGLKENKTISHNLVYPEANDIVCIKNYLRLVCQITTKAKVNSNEEAVIKKNIYKQLYTDFNARKVDFGEKLITESIEESIKNADTRIKNISLNEPTLITKFCKADGTEDLAENVYKQTYNWLALRNVLAGRIPLFEYDTDFKPEYSEAKYSGYESVYKKGTNYIKSITSDFNINQNITNGITLNENEVVQFRAPNFKTTLTYPAYVNYFLHLKETNSSSKATPATFGSLRAYMDGDTIFGPSEPKDRWKTFVNQKDTNNKLIITMASKTYKKDSTVEQAKLDKTLYGRLFNATKDGEKITEYTEHTIPESKYSEDTTVYYFDITSVTYGSIYNFICTQDSKEAGKKLLGIFRSLGADQSRSIGKMVDDKKVKYAYCYTQLVSTQPLDNYYIQITFDSDDETTYQHTKDGLGRDADLTDKTIKANTGYQLKKDEWLAINYTPSTTNEDGTTSTGDAVNIVYKENDIIRPNFDMVDSATYKANHSPSKTSGYNFDSTYQDVINSTEGGIKAGMFAFDTKEQVEIRKPVEVVLDSIGTNIYWERNDEDQLTTTEDGDTLVFKYDEDNETAYTLKEGEYIYYTDESKIDLAYYGNGTKIIKKTSTPTLTKRKTDAEKLADKIVNEGLLAALPWTTYDFSGTDKYLTLKEYQYITLTEGDKLVSVGSDDSKIAQAIDKIWKTVTDNKATYQLQDSSTTTSLPGIAITGHEWQVRSILNINMGPTMYQTLHTKQYTKEDPKGTVTIEGNTTNTITLIWSDDTETSPHKTSLTPTKSGTEYVPLCIESNYLCQSSTGSADTRIMGYDAEGNKTGYINDFAVKIFKAETVQQQDSKGSKTNANLNNYGTGNWTKISFKDCAEMTLNANILAGTHGLIMFYYNDTVTEITETVKKAWLTLDTDTDKSLKICNATNGSDELFGTGTPKTWWKNHKVIETGKPTRYYLNNGLNIVEVPQECQITIHAGTNASNSTLVFSDLDLVNWGKETESSTENFIINPAIDYKKITEPTIIAQILKDLAANDKDYKFYYNAVIDNSTAIDLNTTIGEKLSDADTWYDYNNINNKFVISEIDADYLPTGITLTSSSKR